MSKLNDHEFQARLARRARQAGVSIGKDLSQGLEAYFRLLAKWNRKINLSGLNLDDPDPTAIDRLLIEPLVAAKYAGAAVRSMIDIGSGGGSPAIPMALALAPLQIVMVESKTRKAVFLQEAIRELKLTDATVANVRYETLLATPSLHEHHDLLTVRALRVSQQTLNAMQAFVRPGGAVMLFRPAGSDAVDTSVMPPLTLKNSYPLLDSLHSRVVLLEKLNRNNVPRGTVIT